MSLSLLTDSWFPPELLPDLVNLPFVGLLKSPDVFFFLLRLLLLSQSLLKLLLQKLGTVEGNVLRLCENNLINRNVAKHLNTNLLQKNVWVEYKPLLRAHSISLWAQWELKWFASSVFSSLLAPSLQISLCHVTSWPLTPPGSPRLLIPAEAHLTRSARVWGPTVLGQGRSNSGASSSEQPLCV